MGETVKYDENIFNNMQAIFKENNEIIINALKKIFEEVNGIKNVLDTPKSAKLYPQYGEYLEEKIKIVVEKGESFEQLFDSIKKEYNDYLEDIRNGVE